MFFKEKNLSIVKRLGLVFSIANGIALVSMFVSFSAIVLYFSQRSFSQELASIIQVLASTSRAAIAFTDADAGKRVLASLQHKIDIEYLALRSRDGTFLVDQGGFGAQQNAKNLASALIETATKSSSTDISRQWHTGHLVMSQPVVLDGEILGDVVAVVELSSLYHQIILLICIAAAVTLVIAAGTFVFLYKFRSWVIKPLRSLKQVAQQISLTKDFSSRLETTRDDEINELFKAFNQMLVQIEERDKSLMLAKNKAEEADKAKSLFVASVSHELRTPLHTILGLANELLESGLGGEREKLMRTLVTAGDSLLFIINDILDFSKIEAGKLNLEPHPYQLRALVDRVSAVFKFPFKKKNVELQARLATDLSDIVVGDSNRIAQVLINLIGNALKFTPEGGLVELSIGQYTANNATKDMLHFSVRDTGIGIPESQLDKIFDAFTQVRAENVPIHSPAQGTGLGLAISSRLVRLMGGWMWVESSLGQGSCFNFVISCPASQSIDAQSLPDKSEVSNASPEAQSVAQKKQAVIMVVEDNLVNQALAKRLLEKNGYTVMVASNGQECVDQVRKHKVDAILMDINMPVMDGIEATKIVRKEESGSQKRIKIIALTASVSNDDSETCFQAGMDAFVTKPFNRQSLLQIIEEQLKDAAQAMMQH